MHASLALQQSTAHARHQRCAGSAAASLRVARAAFPDEQGCLKASLLAACERNVCAKAEQGIFLQGRAVSQQVLFQACVAVAGKEHGVRVAHAHAEGLVVVFLVDGERQGFVSTGLCQSQRFGRELRHAHLDGDKAFGQAFGAQTLSCDEQREGALVAKGFVVVEDIARGAARAVAAGLGFRGVGVEDRHGEGVVVVLGLRQH